MSGTNSKHNHDQDDDNFSQLSQVDRKQQNLSLEDYLSILLFSFLALTLLLQVLSRYLFNAPLGWTEEFARYFLILLSFFGASIVVRKNTHIQFTFFVRYIPQRFSHLHQKIISSINLVFLVFLCISAMRIAPRLTSHEMSSISLSISMLYYVLAFAVALAAIRAIHFLLHSTGK